jgi:hypothetical protein
MPQPRAAPGKEGTEILTKQGDVSGVAIEPRARSLN